MSNKLCRKVIETKLRTWAVGRTTPLAVAWENVAFDNPPPTYLRAYLLPARTTGADLAGDVTTFRGVYQISVVTPINTGPGAAESIADEIAALFPLDSLLTTTGFKLQVVTPCTTAQGMQDANEYVVPVSFTYRADVTA